MTPPAPTITIAPLPEAGGLGEGDRGLETIAKLLIDHRGRADRAVSNAIGFLVKEGRRFAETDSGRRWSAMLAESKLVMNGWILWNMLDLDRYLTGRDEEPGGDTPAAMIEDVLRDLNAIRLEEIIRLIRNLTMEQGQAEAEGSRNG